MCTDSGTRVNISVRRVQKGGHQLVINLPREVRAALSIQRGDYVWFTVYRGTTALMGKYDPVEQVALQLGGKDAGIGNGGGV